MATPVIIDIVILIILLVFTILGAKRGLLQSLAGLVILIVSLVGASMAANALTDPALELMSPLVERGVERRVDAALAEQAIRVEDTTVEELLELIGVDARVLDDLARRAHDSVRDQGVDIAVAVVESLAHSIIHALLFGLAFLAILVLLKVIVKALDLILLLPVLRTLNRTGGALVGLVQGLLVLMLLVWLARHFGWPVEKLTEGSGLIQYIAARIGMPLAQ